MSRITGIAFTLLVAASPLRAQEMPADLGAVPASAAGFLHVRVGDLWQSDFFKDLRASVLKAGPKALEAFDQRFVPAPSTIDRVTIILLDPRSGGEPPFVGIISCSKPFDGALAAKSLLPQGKEMKAGGKTYVADAELDLALHIINDRTLAIAPTAQMQTFLESNKPAGANPFAAALKEAAGNHHLTLALNSGMLPGEAIAELPEALQPLARAKMAQLSLDFGKDLRAEIRLQYGDEAQAKSGETAAREGVKMAREALAKFRTELEGQLMPKGGKTISPISELPEAALAVAGLGAIATADEFLKDPPLKREGDSLAATVVVPAGPYTSLLGVSGVAAGFALPAVQKVRGAATRSRSANNMKQILLAFHNYHDTYGALPAAAICDPNGKPLLSWRVAILPYIEGDNLYKQFHLDEPWDSEHNKKLIPLMPKVYALPNVTKDGESTTHYRAFVGNGAGMELKKGTRFADFTDGLSNTLLIVEAAEPVEWTKPDDLAYDPTKPLPKLGKLNPEGFWAGMGDGSVRFIPKTVNEKTLRALITRNGGEVIESFDK
jgi:hypothetical protein